MQFTKDISMISRYLRRQRNAYMEPLGLKSIHARYLMEVCQTPGLSQDALVQLLGFDKSGIARHAAYLEEEGYLERRPGKDKRVLHLYPTEKTLQLYPKMQEAMNQWESTLLQGLSPEDRKTLKQLLAQVRRVAEQEEVYG